MSNEDIDCEIERAVRSMGIPFDTAWQDPVRSHLMALRAAIALVEDFEIPEETEQAPVFEA